MLECLRIKETIDVILISEAGQQMILVLIYPSFDISGEANIKSARFACHDVNIIDFHGSILAMARLEESGITR